LANAEAPEKTQTPRLKAIRVLESLPRIGRTCEPYINISFVPSLPDRSGRPRSASELLASSGDPITRHSCYAAGNTVGAKKHVILGCFFARERSGVDRFHCRTRTTALDWMMGWCGHISTAAAFPPANTLILSLEPITFVAGEAEERTGLPEESRFRMASRLVNGRFRVRVRVRTLLALVAVVALALWAGLMIFSPTRRLGRLVRPDQPAYVRREAASDLGYQIPPWEVADAVSILIRVCDDPSPRVREYAALGLAQHESKAEAGVPKLLGLLHDDDRYVRYSAAAALGCIVPPTSERCAEVAEVLVATLDDSDRQVQLRAAVSLCRIGRTREASGTLADAFGGSDDNLRAQARSLIARSGIQRRPLVACLMPELRGKDSKRRQGAYDALKVIAGPAVIEAGLQFAAGSDDPETRAWASSKLERLDNAP
jgi:hypothetical protein